MGCVLRPANIVQGQFGGMSSPPPPKKKSTSSLTFVNNLIAPAPVSLLAVCDPVFCIGNHTFGLDAGNDRLYELKSEERIFSRKVFEVTA